VDGEADIDSGLRESAEAQQKLGIGLYAVGGVALAAGMVMAFLNQPVVVRREIPGVDMGAGGGVAVVPLVAPGVAGIRARVSF
jgi:hypothetical protein